MAIFSHFYLNSYKYNSALCWCFWIICFEMPLHEAKPEDLQACSEQSEVWFLCTRRTFAGVLYHLTHKLSANNFANITRSCSFNMGLFTESNYIFFWNLHYRFWDIFPKQVFLSCSRFEFTFTILVIRVHIQCVLQKFSSKCTQGLRQKDIARFSD